MSSNLCNSVCLKIVILSTGARSSYEFQWLDLKTGHQESSPNFGYQSDLPTQLTSKQTIITLFSYWSYQVLLTVDQTALVSILATFFALLALCEGNLPVTSGFPSQRPVTRGSDVFFDVCLNKWWSKQSKCRWFVTQWRSLWRHCNGHHTNSDFSLKGAIYTLSSWKVYTW